MKKGKDAALKKRIARSNKNIDKKLADPNRAAKIRRIA